MMGIAETAPDRSDCSCYLGPTSCRVWAYGSAAGPGSPSGRRSGCGVGWPEPKRKRLRLSTTTGANALESSPRSSQAKSRARSRNVVAAVGSRLADAVKDRRREFRFSLVRAGVSNAYALPGGFVFITEPLLDLCAQDRDELAFLLGHEMGHVLRGHARSQLTASTFLQCGDGAAVGRGPDASATDEQRVFEGTGTGGGWGRRPAGGSRGFRSARRCARSAPVGAGIGRPCRIDGVLFVPPPDWRSEVRRLE